MTGNRFVCGQHELFDKSMGNVAGTSGDADHLTLWIELNDRLGEIEIDGTSLHALAIELEGEFFHQIEALDQASIPHAKARVALEQKVDVSVSHPLDAADDPACK